MRCEVTDCKEEAVYKVFWPGQMVHQCTPHKEHSASVASAMGFNLAVEALENFKEPVKQKKNLCLDFDGVLHAYTSGWHGADVVSDMPVPGAKEFLEDAIKIFDVYILSSRSGQQGGIHAMRTWMCLHFGVDLVKELYFTEYKPAAFLSIDDRAITFDGVWPSPLALLKFKPWNK